MVLDDVVGNVETIERLKVIAEDGNMPHIIISVSSSTRCRTWTAELLLKGCVLGHAWYRKDDFYSLLGTRTARRCLQRGSARIKRKR
jgi:hypothetical protein